METLPDWVLPVFIGTWVLSLLGFRIGNVKGKRFTAVLVLWSILQLAIAYIGFYKNTKAVPPRFLLVLAPPLLLTLFSLFPKSRNWIIHQRNLALSSFLHTVRIPVEICIHQFYLVGFAPALITYEGRNFDILAGLTAPIVGWLFYKNKIGKTTLLVWNIVGLGLILNILFYGVLSTELPIQQFAFEQPNRAMAYFPYILLPAIIAPLVLWTHVTDILTILYRKEK